MRVLMIGDVVAKPGRVAVLERIQDLREQHRIDLAVMNAENVAGGFSITPTLADQLFQSGIDVMTSGNHIFDKRDIIPYIECNGRLLRPANYPPGTPGAGLWHVRVRVVDMHAEATSEKSAMGWFLDGRVSAVVGTHTHVQTADERILTEGTAYLTDIGMTGSYAGCIGMNKDDVIARFTSVTRPRAEHSTGNVRICAAVIDIDETTGRAREISRLSLPHES
ncbi:MAG: YmdB family metallophosphoesterase [Acidobacteria bacterium]|nr:YmdB family metallophosphoesterase [Acidobacteriota bacterium]